MDDNRLDELIDEVARQMTAGEPRADFRGRVLDRIHAGVRIRSTRFGPRDLAMAGLAVAILTAIVIWRNGPVDNARRHEAARIASSASPSNPGTPAAVPLPRLPQTETTETTDRTAAIRRPSSPGSRQIGTVDGAHGPSSEIDALAPARLVPSALSVESIGVPMLRPADSIRIDKLTTITPVAVSPLGEGEQRP